MTQQEFSKNELSSARLPFIRTKLAPGDTVDYAVRLGTPVEKGVSLTEEKLISVEEEIKKKIAFWTAYPDIWCDEILTPTGSSFSWADYQRIQLRTQARVSLVHMTGARGVSKTFTAVFGFFHRAVFHPESSLAITAPSKSQAAQIAKQTVNDILNRFPTLRNELDGNPVGGKDSYEVRFRNDSKIEITAALETTRGRRFDGILVDETRDQDPDAVNGILIPTVSKVRATVGAGIVNPYEPQQLQWYYSSASAKSSYNYEKVWSLFLQMIIDPRNAFVLGMDYRVPVAYGIYPASFVQNIKSDPTMTERLFAQEYMSIYTAENDSSWFNFKKIDAHRKLVNAEWQAKFNNGNKDTFYLLSVDVGRLHDSTVVVVHKVVPNKGRFRSIVANIFVLGRTNESRRFSSQALDLKKIIRAFNPREVVIDTNGLGISLADEMIREHIDTNGESYGPLGFYNDDNYKKIQPQDAPRILCSFKASRAINSEMFGNCYSRIEAGLVDFLLSEQDARSKLLSTKRGQKMSLAERAKFLMPYEMTTKLFQEMGNLRLKRTGSGLDIILEPINSRFPDDKFSSLCIGLRRIKQLEEEYKKKMKRGSGPKRNLVFFSGGKR